MPTEISSQENDSENRVHQPPKRFKNNFHEKLKKDLDNLKHTENYSQTNLLRLEVRHSLLVYIYYLMKKYFSF